MAYETEIKLQIKDMGRLRRVLQRLRARLVGRGSGRVHEENLIFDTPQGGLAKHGQLLRIRVETPVARGKSATRNSGRRVVLTFKQPVAGSKGARFERREYKVREETELEVSAAGPLTKIFEGLGMSGWFRYEKYRTTYRLPASKNWARGLLIELDETPIGTFVELEGPAEAIDRVAHELGFSKTDYILKNYLVLYVEDCRKKGTQPNNMVFSEQKQSAK
jgi:adenylate cyclase, class 2